jgi:transcriptional regulator with XRE-family HTH domain
MHSEQTQGAAIKAARERAGLTQEQAAAALNVPPKWIQRREQRTTAISVEDLGLLAGVYHLTPSTIAAIVGLPR